MQHIKEHEISQIYHTSLDEDCNCKFLVKECCLSLRKFYLSQFIKDIIITQISENKCVQPNEEVNTFIGV